MKRIYLTLALSSVVFSACARQSMPGPPADPANNNQPGVASEGAANPVAVSESRVFQGTIGASNDLQMKLVRTGTELSGTYSYLKIGKPITLKGTIDTSNKVQLSEYDAAGTPTGVFKGKWDATDSTAIRIEGNWSKPDSTKQTKFSLTEQPIAFSAGLELTAKRLQVSEDKLKCDIDVLYPQLSGSTDVRVARFNALVKGMIFKKISAFKKGLAEIAATEEEPPSDSDMRSDLNIGYTVGLANDDLISLGFEISGYSRGAAHPNSYSEVVNYDFKNGKTLKLADLFQPGSNYMKLISNYCLEDLKKQSKEQTLMADWIQRGAGPQAANYKSWTITRKGLDIIFDPYQVGPYAAGPQFVTVPYPFLKESIKADGPLAPFVK